MTRLRRPLALLIALLAGGGLAGCGVHHDEDAPVVRIEGEGFYLKVGEMKYQVQISRQLNADDLQDRVYLTGVPADQRVLKADEVWFGVFMQVQNDGSHPMSPSADIEITDTQEDIFKPLALEPTNLYAYRPTTIEPGAVAPLKDTPGFDTPIQGSLLLFKLSLAALDNRPLELKIESTAPQQTGLIDLDV